jgi:hypothetical protein
MKLLIMILGAVAMFIPSVRGGERSDSLRNALHVEYERALEFSAEEGSVTPLLDVLDGMQEDPLDINGASTAELEQIPSLSPLIAFRIVSRRTVEPFQKVEDLSKVEGVTPDILRAIDPFVTVKRKSLFTTGDARQIHLRTRVARSSIGRSGASNGAYSGSPEKLYSKIVARIGGLQSSDPAEIYEAQHRNSSLLLGLVTEKDPGERDYLDFVSGHLCATIPSISARFVLGDFLLESGQGLVFWRPTGFSKGSEATANVARNGGGVLPSLSSDQGWYFRGAAANVEFNTGLISLFYSIKPFDAGIDTGGVVTRFDVGGLHRTEAEMQGRNKVTEKAYGARIGLSLAEGLTLGASGIVTTFDRIVSLPGAFGFHGDRCSVVGLDVSYTQSNMRIFAEVAQDYKLARAGVFGVLLTPCAGASLALLARFYPGDFKSLHGSGFNENGSKNENESGVYCGFSYRPSSWLSLSAYYDQFIFPWRTTRTSFPSNGNEVLVRAEIHPNRRVNLELRLRHKEKPASNLAISPFGLTQKCDDTRGQRNYRATLTAGSSESLLWRSRIEVVEVKYPARWSREVGMLAYQDFCFVPIQRLSVTIRAIAFQTDAYDSRVYEFEEEVPGTYQNPALYGKGLRWYIIGRYDYGRRMSLSLKYSQTRREEPKNRALPEEAVVNAIDDRLAVQIDIRL